MLTDANKDDIGILLDWALSQGIPDHKIRDVFHRIHALASDGMSQKTLLMYRYTGHVDDMKIKLIKQVRRLWGWVSRRPSSGLRESNHTLGGLGTSAITYLRMSSGSLRRLVGNSSVFMWD